MGKAYQDDLAYIHDVGFGGFAIKAAPGLLAILRKRGITKGLVVDLGCGSGLWARELCTAGYDVLGIDISAAMIDLARRRVPEARFRNESFLSASLPPCDAVTAIGECFNYLFDKKNSAKALARFFRRVYDALRPGGVFVFDIAEPGRVPAPRRSHWEGKDWAVLVHAEEDKSRNVLTRRITTLRKVGELYRRGEEVHRLRLYRSPALAEQLRRVGFKVRILRGYGSLRFAVGHAALLARKP
ncbi:MAG TPA: class I SAM-dependent methyltransferase [Gemmataceae bacterium]|jgi:SAM-dependent methyltransferase|nr:class I SAM-dependent methyltransferase [Gemmataceae bacterium]